jgi:hypothetical protein
MVRVRVLCWWCWWDGFLQVETNKSNSGTGILVSLYYTVIIDVGFRGRFQLSGSNRSGTGSLGCGTARGRTTECGALGRSGIECDSREILKAGRKIRGFVVKCASKPGRKGGWMSRLMDLGWIHLLTLFNQSLPHCSDKNWSTLTERTCLAQRQLVIAFSVTNPATSRISRDGNLEDLRIFQFH